MQLHEFTESTYVSTNIEIQEHYSVWGQAKTQSCQEIINMQRKFYKWINFPILIVRFLLIRLKIMEEPKSAKQLMEELKQLKEDQKLKAVPEIGPGEDQKSP